MKKLIYILFIAIPLAILFAATESQAPLSLTSTTNLDGAVTDIDEDPDSPDGNWMACNAGNNVNTAITVDFNAPTGNPTVGADLQEFKAWVRQYDEGQTGTPDVRIELWENGGFVRAGSNESVTTSGHMITFTWNANELATPDGSQVEMRVIGTASGGAPAVRNTVDMGAVEWNVDYTAGGGRRIMIISEKLGEHNNRSILFPTAKYKMEKLI